MTMNFLSHVIKKELLKKDWFTGAFPVPSSLILSDTSVDVSDSLLRFFECSRKRGVCIPKDFGTLPLPRIHTAVDSTKAREETSLAIRNWAKNRKQKMVRAIIHEDEAYVFKVTVPTTNPKEIYSAVEGLLEENVPIPPADCLFEYEIVSLDETLKEATLAVSVISRSAASNYLDIFKESGIQVVSLETEARATAKALFRKDETGVHAVVVIAKHHSIVFIAEKGSVVFSSSLAVGQTDLTTAVAKTLNITQEAAEALKKEKESAGHESDMKLFEAMIPVFGTLRDELGKVLAYWKTQGKKERNFIDVSDVILLGKDSLTTGFAQYISASTKIPAKIGSVWTNTLPPDVSLPKLHKADSLDYGALVGTIL
ncbi:MAG: type 4 fimbrial biosis protein PilM, type pilus assembly protein PilM [Candidatus Parcubacteria bacterium]|jgi:Tfp pilus assembly PilM family ATPase